MNRYCLLVVFLILNITCFFSQGIADNQGNMCIKNHEVVKGHAGSSVTPSNIELVDLNGDVYSEAIYINRIDTTLYYARNAAGQQTVDVFSSVTYSVHRSNTYLSGNIVAGDFDGDGRNDIIVCNSIGHLFALRNQTNNPIPQFSYSVLTSSPVLGASPFKSYVYKTHADNDGKIDLVVVGKSLINTSGYDFCVLKNTSTTGNISFTAFYTGQFTTSLSVTMPDFDLLSADIDGDGDDELFFVCSENNDQIQMALNNSTAYNVSFIYGGSNNSIKHKKIKFLDLNNDGKKEFAILSSIPGLATSVTVLSPIYIGSIFTGSLNLVVNANYFFEALDFTFADFSQDGKMDLILNKKNSSEIHCYKQSGTSTFNFSAFPDAIYMISGHQSGSLYSAELDRVPTSNYSHDVVSATASPAGKIILLRNFTRRNLLYTTPSSSLICTGQTFTVHNILENHLPPLPFYSGLTGLQGNNVTQTITISSPTVIPPFTNYYAMFSVNGQTCEATSDTLRINPAAQPSLSISAPTHVCKDSLVFIKMNGTGVQTYTWMNTGTSNIDLTIPVTSPFYVSIKGHSYDGCIDSTSKYIDVAPDFSVSVVSNPSRVCVGKTATLTATGAQNYVWLQGGNTNVYYYVQSMSSPMQFTVQGWDAYGCVRTATFQSQVSDECRDITISNGITPNNDGKNDFFYIENIEYYPENKVSIYNRWGKELFNSKGYDNKEVVWPRKGETLPSGTYFYVLELGDGTGISKGWLEILD